MAMGTITKRVAGALEWECIYDYDREQRVGVLLPERDLRQTLNTARRRRLSESRMRENLMSGSMRQGMETRYGVGIEALS